MGKHIRFDWAIKRLLRQKANFGILEGFLSELLKQDVAIADILESEGNKEHESDKYNVVDILVKNTQGELALIEVQNTKEIDFFHRMNYGQAKLLTEHISEGASYDQIKKVFSINIVYFDLGQGKDYIYKGTTNFIGLHEHDTLGLSATQKEAYPINHVSDIYTTYYLLKVNTFDNQAKDTLDEWVYFLKNSEIKDDFKAKGLAEAKEKLRVDEMDEKEKADYDRYIKSDRVKHGEYKYGKVDGIKETEEKLKPIIEEERKQKEVERKQKEEERKLKEEAEAREQEAKTKEQEANITIKKSILNLKNKGMDLGQIAEVLDKTIEEVKKIIGS